MDVGGTVTQISAGSTHTCALLSTGNVRCWGSGGITGFSDRGQLGYGNIADIGDDELPASAGDVDVGGPVTQIAAGRQFTCALLSSGNVRCWGTAQSGANGYPLTSTIGDDELPTSAGDVCVLGNGNESIVSPLQNCQG